MKVKNNTGKRISLVNKDIIDPYSSKEIKVVTDELLSQLKQLEKNKIVRLS